jgi:hypothetical protein
MPRREQKSAASRSEKRGRGRPTTDKKGDRLEIRLSEADAERLDALVGVRKEDRSTVVRDLIRDEHGRFVRKGLLKPTD